jgi:hypothetical protein
MAKAWGCGQDQESMASLRLSQIDDASAQYRESMSLLLNNGQKSLKEKGGFENQSETNFNTDYVRVLDAYKFNKDETQRKLIFTDTAMAYEAFGPAGKKKFIARKKY